MAGRAVSSVILTSVSEEQSRCGFCVSSFLQIRSWQPSSTSSDCHDEPEPVDDDGTGLGLGEQQTAGAVGRLVGGNVGVGEEMDPVSGGGGSSSLPSVSSSSIASHASRLLGATAPAQRKVPSAEHENGSDGRASPADGLQHLKPVPPQRRDRAGEEDDDSTRGKGVTGGMRGRPGAGGKDVKGAAEMQGQWALMANGDH